MLALYLKIADTILENYFHPDKLLPQVDILYEQILTDLETDPFPSRRATNKQDQNYNDMNFSEIGATTKLGPFDLDFNYLLEQKHIGDQDYFKTKVNFI